MNSLRTLPLLLLTLFAMLAGFAAPAIAQAPAIASFTPASGPVGALVTINGSNFHHDQNGAVWTGAVPYRVRFPMSGGVADIAPTFVSATQIRVTVPNGAATGPLRIVQGFTVLSTSSTNFTVLNLPRITGFTPASGPVGSVVHVNGANFNRDANGNTWTGSPPYRIRFATSAGTTDVLPTFVSLSQINVVVPANAITGALRLVQGATVLSSSATNFAVTATLLRITNNTQYDMISLTLNGVQQFAPQSGVLQGSTVNLPANAGTFTLVAGIGFYRQDGTRDIWFTFNRTVTITANATTTQTFAPITIGQLLTMGAATRDWSGLFFDNNAVPHQARFRFTSAGGWQFFKDGVLQGSGNLTLISWPARSASVTFRIATNLPDVTLAFPFGSFLLRNGPPSWPVIQYQRQ